MIIFITSIFPKKKAGTPEHPGFECETCEIWENKFNPELLKNWMQIDPGAINTQFDRSYAAGKWTHLTGVEPFGETRSLLK